MAEKTCVYSLDQARKIDYTVEPIRCPSCKHIGEVVYNQYTDEFSCQWCGKSFPGKKVAESAKSGSADLERPGIPTGGD